MTWFRRAVLLGLCGLSLAVSSFANGRKSHSIDADVAQLYSANAKTREQAATSLTAVGARVIPKLVPVVCNKKAEGFDRAWPVAAKILGELRAEAASECLVELLLWRWPSIGTPTIKSDQTLSDFDSAFAALVHIGGPAVPMIRRSLPTLRLEQAYVALRALRVINTPAAKEAAAQYVRMLEDETRFANEVLQGFGQTR